MTSDAKIRVLLSVRGLDRVDDPSRNPYIDLLVDSLPGDVEVLQFSWGTALTGRFDVFHSHWPEALVRSAAPWVRAVEYVLFVVFLARLRLGRKGVVHTAHNDRPHELSSPIEAFLLRMYFSSVTLFVDLNPVPTVGRDAPRVVIPHGDYQRWLSQHSRAPSEYGRICTFGMIRRYKNIPGLLRAFRDVDDPAAVLTVLGSVSDAALGEEIEDLAAVDPRVELRLRYAGDAELVREITRSALVVLPYEHIKNTGAGIYALTLARPILVPRTPETKAMRAEFGEAWVHLFSGPLTGAVITDTLRRLTSEDRPGPDLSGRDWSQHGLAHRAAYVQSRPRRHGGRRSSAARQAR